MSFDTDRYEDKIQQATALSKNGHHTEALEIFEELIAAGELSEIHHIAYGWCIYRYIRDEHMNLPDREVKTWLKKYLDLKNPRPDQLHSVILHFAASYSKKGADFAFDKFFELWNPALFRQEDFLPYNKEGENLPSLLTRVCHELLKKEVDPEYLLKTIPTSKETILERIREGFFWLLISKEKEDRGQLWDLLTRYNQTYASYGGSVMHSQILEFAEKKMTEKDEFRFPGFFKDWNPGCLQDTDYPSLATKALRKCFKTIRNQEIKEDIGWLMSVYDKTVERMPNEEWTLREKAILHSKTGETDTALEIYRKLILNLSDKYYVWAELASCISGNLPLKTGLLAKALLVEKNEDFLGDIRLELAKTLVEQQLPAQARTELDLYKQHRNRKGWSIAPLFHELYTQVKATPASPSNTELYHQYAFIAEEFAYNDLDWTHLALVHIQDTGPETKRYHFSDGKAIHLTVKKNFSPLLAQAHEGDIFSFKINKKEDKYLPLLIQPGTCEKWSVLPDIVAVIDYINPATNTIHAITTDHKMVFFPQATDPLHKGDFIQAKQYSRKTEQGTRDEIKNIRKIDKQEAIPQFPSKIAIVDGVNEEKQLFHFVINSQYKGNIYHQATPLRPQVGDFIQIRYAIKTDKEKKKRILPLDVSTTTATDPNLRKETEGMIQLKYKDQGKTLDYEDIRYTLKKEYLTPDFAFINDYYIPKNLLRKYDITQNRTARATLVYTGEKWKVYDIL